MLKEGSFSILNTVHSGFYLIAYLNALQNEIKLTYSEINWDLCACCSTFNMVTIIEGFISNCWMIHFLKNLCD